VRYAMDIRMGRRVENLHRRILNGRLLGGDFDFEAALLADLALERLVGIFVQFDVAANGEPLVERRMVDHQDAPGLHDVAGDGEGDGVMDMRQISSALAVQRCVADRWAPRSGRWRTLK